MPDEEQEWSFPVATGRHRMEFELAGEGEPVDAHLTIDSPSGGSARLAVKNWSVQAETREATDDERAAIMAGWTKDRTHADS